MPRHQDRNTTAELGLPSFVPDHIVLNYDEIGLKGHNRSFFEKRLLDSAYRALRDAGAPRVRRIFGRLVVELCPGAPWPLHLERLRRLPGVSRIGPALRVPADLDQVKEALSRALAGAPPRSFAILSRRADKTLPFRSVDANRELGAHVQSLGGWPVNLDRPELPIHVYFVDAWAYVAFARIRGPGGLPWGTTGKVVCLLSGGIDSPVAAHRMIARGATPLFAHFHSFPHTSLASQEKVRALVSLLLPHGHRARLYRIPFAACQERIVATAPAPYRVVLYRRFVLRIAEALARREGARALVTGESLGQVASQTLENLHAIGCVATLPVLRPLIGMHKREIVDEARALGTFDTSTEPHDDCCSFLMPLSPVTRSTPRELDEAESGLDVAAESERCAASSEVEEIEGA